MIKPLIDNFIPKCPFCNELMPLIQRQKGGAWNCLRCGSQFWDEVEEVMLGEPDQTNQKIDCLRCKLPMVLYKGVWYCEQCYGQFWPEEKAPEVEAIIDQKIKVKTEHLSYDNMRAKKKSHGNKSGRRRKKALSLMKEYYFD
jgi:ribosomal protein L37AE/L43A